MTPGNNPKTFIHSNHKISRKADSLYASQNLLSSGHVGSSFFRRILISRKQNLTSLMSWPSFERISSKTQIRRSCVNMGKCSSRKLLWFIWHGERLHICYTEGKGLPVTFYESIVWGKWRYSSTYSWPRQYLGYVVPGRFAPRKDFRYLCLGSRTGLDGCGEEKFFLRSLNPKPPSPWRVAIPVELRWRHFTDNCHVEVYKHWNC
jgi:hypothetical protein